MDHGLAARGNREALGGDLAQLAARHQQNVRLVDQLVGDAVVAAEQARAQRIGAGNGALAGHGVRDGDPIGRGERRDVGCRLRDMHAAAAQHQRTLRLAEQSRRARGVVGCGPAADRRRRLVARIDRVGFLVKRQRAVAHVLRHIDHHRARPARGRDQEGARDQLRNAACVLDPDELLARRLQDLGLARLLRHVLPGVRAMRVADEGDERRAGVERLDQAGDEVGGAGPERGIDQPDPAGDLGVGVGREGAAALVVDEVVVELQAPCRVIEREQLEAAHAEHRPGVEGLERAGHRLAAGDLVGLRHRRMYLPSFPAMGEAPRTGTRDHPAPAVICSSSVARQPRTPSASCSLVRVATASPPAETKSSTPAASSAAAWSLGRPASSTRAAPAPSSTPATASPSSA